ncbi:MAG: DUF2304 domain-containing protein [Sharpea porci]|uniref:DUF2304 domain-containing protein n=1 Tax=Sharpea porci TaxID=2652286 RepID=UPI002409ED72|nr:MULTISPECIES: DUF2304 domain-containing protein [Coprobacillaceae]MDD6594904.1 DUF2304 domain-containing protein [Catenibacterium mitsuokai]MDD6710491.1 DUF2304 domain-containing protein [Sharpea porci]
MSLLQRCVFIFASLFTFAFIIKKITRNNLAISDSIVWILWSIFLLIISIFPQIPTFISNVLGFMSVSNFIFTMFIFFMYIMLFYQTIYISQLKGKNRDLVQKLSIKDYQEYLDKKKNKNSR